jgi:hypothetical protein
MSLKNDKHFQEMLEQYFVNFGIGDYSHYRFAAFITENEPELATRLLEKYLKEHLRDNADKAASDKI